ncbi:MAG: MATE family efflux transporter [Spirochaetaceae bacterium]|nr:MATE family efflux transporter [Spirochaetaceae bacterium]
MRGRNLTSGSIPSLSWSLAWPVMLSILFQTLYQLVDAFWVSRLSDNAMAAVTVSQITLFVMISLTIGITVGSGVVMAMSIGRRDIPEAERVMGQSFVLNFIAAVLFTTISLSLRGKLLSLTGATGDILPLAVDYFTIVAGGSVLMFIFFAVIFGFNSQGDNRTVTWLFAISTTINAGLDPLLIFGGLGIPALGVRGAALATIISQILLVIAGITLLHQRDMMVKFRFRNLVFRLHSVRQVLAIGFPAALTNLLNPAGLAALNALVALAFLEAGVVGLSIGFRIEFFSFLPAIGFGVAAMAMIGQNIGGGRPDRARMSYHTALLFAFGIGTAVGLAAMLTRGAVVGVFTDDPVVIGYTRSYLAMIPLTYGIVAALFVVVSSFQGLGKSWRGFAVSATRVAILVGGTLLVTRAVAPGASITGVWWIIVIANLVAFAFGYLLLRRTFRAVLSAPAPAWGGARPGGGPGTDGGPGPPGKPRGPQPEGALADGAADGGAARAADNALPATAKRRFATDESTGS